MENNITRSPEILAKEAKVRDLQKVLKKRKSILKDLKTHLKNTQNEVKDVQRDVQNIMFSKTAEMEVLRVEIGELVLEIKQNKHLNKADKNVLNKMAEMFLGSNLFGERFEHIRKAQRKRGGDFDEKFRAKMNDAFRQFRVEPKAAEQKDIRKVFIKLSLEFHPDLAENDKQAADYHVIMQQINEAYKANDIHTLLEMEQLYLTEDFDFTIASITIDVLQNEIVRLQRDIDFINGQVDRTSSEIKQLGESKMGSMLAGIKKSGRKSGGLKAMEAEFNRMIQQLEQIKTGFVDSIKRVSISPILIQLINPSLGLVERDMRDDYPEDLENLFDDSFGIIIESEDDDYEINVNPKFSVGTPVRVKHAIRHTIDNQTAMKDWQGWVDFAYINEDKKPAYTIRFDIPTIQKMSNQFIEKAVEEGFEFQKVDLLERQIQTAKTKENINKAIAFAKGLRIDMQWKNRVDEEDLMLIKKILKANIQQRDEDNWMTYLKSLMPFKAKAMGKFEFEKGKVVIVEDIDRMNTNIGFIVVVQEEKGRRFYEYPLDDLMPVDKFLLPVFELHGIWFHSIYEGKDI